MKKRVTVFLLLLLVLILPTIAYASSYVGNARTHKFHYDSCRYVSQMNESNKVWFETREEAIAAGYVPCKVCRP
jgi:methylphosphotriester-DNA--protein-cysteine methyltransferase